MELPVDQQQGQHDAAPEPPAIELIGISKAFGPVQANKDISMKVARGTIHGIIGENGAGKSTLMSILYGFYKADKGEIRIGGKPTQIANSDDAIRAGIGMVHQHFMLVQNFTVLENVVLGAEGGRLLKPSLARARALLTQLAHEYELDVLPDALISDLAVGFQQRVEILKALYRDADILILDEPTGVLTPAEADHLFRILEGLKAEGKTIILITHKLREIMDVTDTVSVMRRGEMTATLKTADTSPTELAELMVGRKVLLRVDKPEPQVGDTLMRIRGLKVTAPNGVELLKGIHLNLNAGEILGIAGVAGNGQSTLLEVLAGITPASAGSVELRGEELDLTGRADPGKRRDQGLAHVPEDRHRLGLVMPFAEWENSCFGYHDRDKYTTPRGFLRRREMRDDARAKIEQYDIRPPNCDLPAMNFSGGNQQKIVIAREIERDPDLLLVGQPTRGVDIGAIEFIHQQIVRLRDQGKAVLLVSVELEEILALSDRIVVMCDGRITGERTPDDTDENELGMLMAGIDPRASA